MTTLENLYNGNINPCDSERLKSNSNYKKLLSLVSQAQENLNATLIAEQRELFENYLVNANELSVIIDEEIFKEGFSLAMKIMIEISAENI